MNEAIEPAIIAQEPVSWLVEHQRAACAGATPLATFQGLLNDEIVLPEGAVNHDDPAQIVLALNAWVEALLTQAHFLPGEFAQEALWSYQVHDYLTQVKAGGHAQYFANRGTDEIALRCCDAGLKSMLADPHRKTFNLMLRLKRSNPKTARRIATEAGYRSVEAAWRDLDKRFAATEAEEPLLTRQKLWLRSLRKVTIVPDAEMDQHLNRIARGNALYQRRREEAERARAEHMRDDPAYRSARSLCEMAGLTFSGLRSIGFAPMRTAWAQGPDVQAYALRIDTNRGPRAALFYTEGRVFKRRLAVLVEQGGGLPLGSLTLSAEEFTSIVPAMPA